MSNNNCMSTLLTFTDLSFEIRFTQMALTYIGSYEKEVETRLFYHHKWVKQQMKKCFIRVRSIGFVY